MSTRCAFYLDCMGDGEPQDKCIVLRDVQTIQCHILDPAIGPIELKPYTSELPLKDGNTKHDLTMHEAPTQFGSATLVAYFDMHKLESYMLEGKDTLAIIKSCDTSKPKASEEHTYLEGQISEEKETIPLGVLRLTIPSLNDSGIFHYKLFSYNAIRNSKVVGDMSLQEFQEVQEAEIAQKLRKARPPQK